MSDTLTLKDLVEKSGLATDLQEVEQVDESMCLMRKGSAVLVVGIKERALVVISPLFKGLPAGREAEFCFHLLGLNSALGGIANFAIQPDGWVVLQGGRDVRGMDTDEFRTLVIAVAETADHFDNVLLDEFYTSAGESADDAGVQDAEEADASEDSAAAGAPAE